MVNETALSYNMRICRISLIILTIFCKFSSQQVDPAPRNFSSITQKDALELNKQLELMYQFRLNQILELTGLPAARVIGNLYYGSRTIFVICGPGKNGITGLAIARHLQQFGFQVTVYLTRSKDKSKSMYIKQTKEFGVKILENYPRVHYINTKTDLVVDCLFGYNFTPPLNPVYDQLISDLDQISKPIVSIDIPSGWDVDEGCIFPQAFFPQVLISLMVPKKCSSKYVGCHFLAGRFIPSYLMKLFNINIPQFPEGYNFVRLSSRESCY